MRKQRRSKESQLIRGMRLLPSYPVVALVDDEKFECQTPKELLETAVSALEAGYLRDEHFGGLFVS